jgi:hypothetical protein
VGEGVLISIDTPYADTTAGDLSFALDLPEQPALHVLEIAPAGLQLRLLGASHQVVLAGRCIETVACLPGRPSSLPAAVDRDGYRFTAELRRLDPAAMSAKVQTLRGRLAGDPYALIGVFPGNPDAVTALCADISGDISAGASADMRAGVTGWHTWHAYPQTGELVVTRTEVIP